MGWGSVGGGVCEGAAWGDAYVCGAAGYVSFELVPVEHVEREFPLVQCFGFGFHGDEERGQALEYGEDIQQLRLYGAECLGPVLDALCLINGCDHNYRSGAGA